MPIADAKGRSKVYKTTQTYLARIYDSYAQSVWKAAYCKITPHISSRGFRSEQFWESHVSI